MNFKSINKLFGYLIDLLNQYDRLLLALLSVVIVITGTIWFRQYAQHQGEGPSPGGTYVMGVIGEQAEVEAIAAEITKTGFFHINSNGKLENTIIEEWKANADQTVFTFKLKQGINQEQIINDLNDNVDLFGVATFESDAENNIIITLPESNPNLPILLAQPLFEYGPYKLSRASGATSILTRNTNALSVNTYLNKIIIQHYFNEAELQTALTKKKIDGARYFDTAKLPSGYSIKEVDQPRYYATILNVNQSPFRDEAYRKALLNGQNLAGKSFTLTAADQEPQKTLANELISGWQSQGAKVTLELKPLAEVRENIAPSRNFQALILGIDYGAELDPYYLWHSSQVRPPSNNVSGVKNDLVDKAISEIRANYNIKERKNLIIGLHELLKSQGIAKVLQQSTEKYILSEGIGIAHPPLSLATHDLVQSLNEWWIR